MQGLFGYCFKSHIILREKGKYFYCCFDMTTPCEDMCVSIVSTVLTPPFCCYNCFAYTLARRCLQKASSGRSCLRLSLCSPVEAELKVPLLKIQDLQRSSFLKPGVCQNTALQASPVARKSTVLTSPMPFDSFFFLLFFCPDFHPHCVRQLLLVNVFLPDMTFAVDCTLNIKN